MQGQPQGQMMIPPPATCRPFPDHLAPHFAQMGVSMEQAANYWNTFNHFDLDGSGTISAAEMVTGLQLMGQCVTPGDVQNMMMQADHNRDGQVDFIEYVRVTHNHVQPQQVVQNDLEAAFRVFDKDGSGTLDANELRAVLCHRGMDNADFDKVMSWVDLDGDGKLNYCEFARLMSQPLGAMSNNGKHGKEGKKDKKDKDKKGKDKDKKGKKKKSKKSKKDGGDSNESDESGSSDCSD